MGALGVKPLWRPSFPVYNSIVTRVVGILRLRSWYHACNEWSTKRTRENGAGHLLAASLTQSPTFPPASRACNASELPLLLLLLLLTSFRWLRGVHRTCAGVFSKRTSCCFPSSCVRGLWVAGGKLIRCGLHDRALAIEHAIGFRKTY